MTLRQMRRALLFAAVLALGLTTTVAAQMAEPPFTDVIPDGWTWWCDGMATCVLLKTNGMAGSQAEFFVISKKASLRAQQVHPWLIGWMGRGQASQVDWSGGFRTTDRDWEAQIGEGNGFRGMAATSGDGWSVGMLAPSNKWEERNAPIYNSILRGDK